MMRLIDKMQLVDTVLKKRYSQASINLILNQPEVKAIPIGWIKKWQSNHTMPYTERNILLTQMIEDWEKENAIISRE